MESRSLSARGYTAFGSFFSDSVEDMISIPDSEWRPPTRAVSDADLWDASSPPPPFGAPFRAPFFFLDSEWTFLNHGAFGGACRPALRAAQLWAEHAEAQPLRFIDRDLFPLMVHSIRCAARLVGAPPASIALCPHATYALHSVITSLVLTADDTLFCLDIGYGSVKKMLALAAERAGARVVVGVVPFPLTTPGALVAAVEAQMPPGCALAVFDHVASNSGLLLPAGALAGAAKRRGARAVLVDGAHGLGALELDLPALALQGVDYYVSNFHKWMCSAKGLALLYVAPGAPALPRPAVLSHGWGAGFASEWVWDGCRDYGAAVALPSLLGWWGWVGLPRARAYCRALLRDAVALLRGRWGTEAHAPPDFYSHMACVQLPLRALPPGALRRAGGSGAAAATPAHSKLLQDALHHAFRIEVPVKTLPGPCGAGDSRCYVRISAMVYNSLEEYVALADAVERIGWSVGSDAGEGEVTLVVKGAGAV